MKDILVIAMTAIITVILWINYAYNPLIENFLIALSGNILQIYFIIIQIKKIKDISIKHVN